MYWSLGRPEAGRGWWEEPMLGSLELAVRAEVEQWFVWVECLRIWYFPRLASGSCVGVALGPGRCYLTELYANCVIGQMPLRL